MARVLVVGDLHFSDRSAKILLYVIKGVKNAIEKEKPDLIVFLGDTLDRHRLIDSVWHGIATDFLIEVSESTPVLLLIGNHDIPNKTYFLSGEHGFRALKHFANISVADTQAAEVVVNDFKFVGVPYCPNGRFQEAVDTYKGNLAEVSAIFAHQEFRGCNMNGISSKHGDKWAQDKTVVISGHIHEYQRLQPNLFYPGTPYQDKSDEALDKSISLFTFTKDVPYPEEKRIYLDVPKKYRLKISPVEYGKLKIDPKNLYIVTVSGLESQLGKYRVCDNNDLIVEGGGRVNFKATDSVDEETLEKFKAIPTIREMVTEAIKEKDYLHKIHLLVYA